MTAVHNPNFSPTRGSDHLDYFAGDGVCLSADRNSGATVVAATGEFDASNINHLTDFVSRHLDHPLALDLRQLDFLAAQGIRALFDLDAECVRRRGDWAVVPGHPVMRLLRICDKDSRLPVVSSIGEALERFSRPTAQTLLKLVAESG